MSAQVKSILLVDDDREFAAAYKLLLQEAGYEVSVAYDGWNGLELARAQKPDLVILDVMMETVDAGFELCRRLRTDASLKRSRLPGRLSGAHGHTGICAFDRLGQI